MFVLLYAAATLAPLPKNVMSAVAGLLFGLAAGIGVVLVAAMLGASIAFVLGRALGRDPPGQVPGAVAGDVIVARSRGEAHPTPWSRYAATADHAAVPQVVFTDPEVAAME